MKAIKKTTPKKTAPKKMEKRYPKLSAFLKETAPKPSTRKKAPAPPQRGRPQKYGMKMKQVTFWLPDNKEIIKEIRTLIHEHLEQYVSPDFS